MTRFVGKYLRKVEGRRKSGEKGFTLIELLIVVAILGILAAIIVPNVTSFLATGTLNAARTEAENVKTAGMAYYADQNPPAWPGDSAALVTGGYFTGTPKATYTFNASGQLSGVSAQTWTGISWDAPNFTWKKP